MDLSDKKILIAEDEQVFADVYELALDNYNITICSNGKEAYDVFKESFYGGDPFDMAFFDVNMPYIEGTKLSQMIREIDEYIPIVIITANRGIDILELSEKTKGDPPILMYKPLNLEHIENLAKSVLVKKKGSILSNKITANKSQNIFLSIIVPAFNEKYRLPPFFKELKSWCSQQSFDSEIIVVDDGSEDDTADTVRILDYHIEKSITTLSRNHLNIGKGYSVAKGIMEADNSKYTIFVDADGSFSTIEINKVLSELIKGDSDIVIASKAVEGSEVTKKSPIRKLMSKVMQKMIKLVIPGVKDPQVGLKGFRTDVAKEIVRHQKIYRWAFDTEQMYIATKLGYRIKEIPVKIIDMEGSKVRIVRDTIRFIFDLFRIKSLHKDLDLYYKSEISFEDGDYSVEESEKVEGHIL